MYTLDLHVHTAESSYCGTINAYKLVELYAKAGYNGIVITDHYNSGFFNRFADMKWSDKVDQFLAGYRTAKLLGKRHDIDVYLGIEFRDCTTENDYLIIGLDEDFLYNNPELYKLPIAKAAPIFHKAGGFISQAHPCRYDVCTPADPSLLDALEVYNGSAHWYFDANRTIAFAKENSLIQLSGSDTHWPEEVGNGGVNLANTPKNIEDIILALKSDDYKIIANPITYTNTRNICGG